MTKQVLRRQRLFKPEQIVRLPHSRTSNRFSTGESLVGIYHQIAMWAQHLPNRRDALGVFSSAFLAYLDLGSAESCIDDLSGVLNELVNRMVQPSAIRVVNRNSVMMSTQHAIEGNRS